MSIYSKLALIQMTLKVPKNQKNSFGGYSYRSCEDILEALKPLLSNEGVVLTISDDIVNVGDRFYVKATATLIDADTGESISNTAYAREELQKKGMDGSQISGAASSYARKYCLSGMFALDDTKDADTDIYTRCTADNSLAVENRPELHPAPAHTPASAVDGHICVNCGSVIKSAKVLEYSLKRYGKYICYDCGRKMIA